MPTWLTMGLQDGASPIMEQLILFHDHTLMIMLMILTTVSYMMVMLMKNKNISRFMLEGQLIETTWTITPAIILVFIAMPSLRLLYLMDEVHTPALTLKVVGHQWYWSYEYSDFTKLEFDSYMTQNDDYQPKNFRLLETDNRIVIPMNSSIRAIVTAADVLHSWAIPSLGVKTDATPGRLNQTSFSITRPGVLYGQCSEICGANHSFMPIVMESVTASSFINWASKLSE
uniref:Cytochrome c oxidase subunit 2 n=4 Tax=Schedorhinotermes TaxID=127390 RepID=A0A411ATA6_9NEOP|nr:cytochrome c oxidase subunit 2 [Schedorhinotermes medioobscurus]QAX91157.1 cytochrome c oxidase subunit 2 [Schedorhinotermes longirostris]QAX91209.1 cytochrome c oxidase subunit 2 [Schedorhinotermes sp. 5 MW-2019]QAX91248.1 cytochrome c oxidase subunit 2 [Schedorhinotermes sp. 9 MW-2019]